MVSDNPLFILAGNNPYDNRGCEAITRGTVKIIRGHFKDPVFICHSHFQNDEQFIRQRANETDDAITHVQSYRLNYLKAARHFWKPNSLSFMYRSLFRPEKLKYNVYRDMLPYLDRASAILSVGGDNYSLDYGVPTLFTDLDDIVLERKKPLTIWGASVGPFDKVPEYEAYMSHHLKKITGILARESETVKYLESIKLVDNVYPTADPAFLMDPVEPDDISIPFDDEVIGVNLSPLMANYTTGGDVEKWTNLAASIIEQISCKFGLPILLIPHVTIPISNDYDFLHQVMSHIPDADRKIILLPPKYNAMETKWIISKMSLFAGARTHSTIAAMSSFVPTLSFAYSIKAKGINRDIFNHTNYCLEPHELVAESIVGKIDSMLKEGTSIRRELRERIPDVQGRASNAGTILKRLVESA